MFHETLMARVLLICVDYSYNHPQLENWSKNFVTLYLKNGNDVDMRKPSSFRLGEAIFRN